MARDLDRPVWATVLPASHEAEDIPHGHFYRGRFYHWCMGALLAVACFVGTNVALGDPIARWAAPSTLAEETPARRTLDAETSAEVESLVRAMLVRLETST